MKNFLITEEETNRIKKLYGLITEEEGGELLDDIGYKVIEVLNKKFSSLQDNGDGTVSIISDENITGKEHDAAIRNYISETIGFEAWNKLPRDARVLGYAFMYDFDHDSNPNFRWLTTLASAIDGQPNLREKWYGKKNKTPLTYTDQRIQDSIQVILNSFEDDSIYDITSGGISSNYVAILINEYASIVTDKVKYIALYRYKPEYIISSLMNEKPESIVNDWMSTLENVLKKETGKRLDNTIEKKKQEPVQPPKKKIGGTPVYQPKTDETFDLFDEKVKQYADDIYGLFTSYVTEGDVTTINSLSTQTPYDEIKKLILKDIGKELYNSLPFSYKMSLYFYCVYFSIKDLSNIIVISNENNEPIDSSTAEYADAMKEIKAGNDEIGFTSRLIGSINFKVQSDYYTNDNDFTRYINMELIYQTANANLKEDNTSKDVVSYIYKQIIEGKKYKTGKTKFSDENKIKTFLGIAIPPVVDTTKKTAQAKNLFRSDKITDFDKKRVKKLQSKIRALDIEKRRIESIDKNDERLPELQDKITKYDNRITRIKSKYSQFEKELEAKKAKSTEDLTKTQVDSKKEKVKGQTSYELKPW